MKKRDAANPTEKKEVLNKVGKSRRGFIRKLVQGTAYVAPLIATFYMDSAQNAYAQRDSTGAGGEKKGAQKKGGEKKGEKKGARGGTGASSR